jgi:uncharacterized membrane protein
MAKKQAESKAGEELKSSLDFTKTTTDRFAVFIAELLGSMAFLIGCMIFFTLWICLNAGAINTIKPFDPFPFPILEMMVSIFAIILSVSVLINQNRQSRVEKTRQQVEFEVNVRAENEITKILNMLHEIHQTLGLHSGEDQELEKMKKTTDVKQIHKPLDDGTE